MGRSLLRTDEELSGIYHRHVKTVYRVCFMYMKNSHDTEDMVQNTFLRLMRDDTQFENVEHEKAWLIRTATNLCKDYFRHWWTKRVSMDAVADVAADDALTIDETLNRVLKLPPRYKTAVFLHYYEGYSAAEIARILGKKASTVRSWLHAARKRLRIEMEGDVE
ncbi:MAG TPA: RNA polymerase sigma factor [Thermoclostridium caenicola]|uniref:RNA polymerase sigma-70 factor, ECF subfamily n=1 Tax=Thermoclostridium caenicola TaxID=659425 RepID=A0A1M6CHT8_9FIRM|nr:RNA polymerase sigma factor [Thermoclostridium caenicola]SHI60483.1 RNA polymerase sigma-70 factor, ECF subfamily [Thermoclostridium caenicola]HOK43038.1 RNA polymerase sigma factor [Thermoclostridium caenicola]HOL84855.1 RNA polymerase sigma factor [Thermoclostridium caenicola]HOP72032.1 RNA polymerase sigma factor [Thermoclostridium caenicola]HPO76993.1 RNA polymerase sigma factor [Thermoclostridium caenicola]